MSRISRILLLIVCLIMTMSGCHNPIGQPITHKKQGSSVAQPKNKQHKEEITVETVSYKNWADASEKIQRGRVIQTLTDQHIPIPNSNFLTSLVNRVGVDLKHYVSNPDLDTVIVSAYDELASFSEKTSLITQQPFTNINNEGDVDVKLLSVVNKGNSTIFIYEDDKESPSIYMSKETNGNWNFKDKILLSKADNVVTVGLIIYQFSLDQSKGIYTILASTYDENGNLTDKEPLPVKFKADESTSPDKIKAPSFSLVGTSQGQAALITGDISTDQNGTDVNNLYYIAPQNPYMVQTIVDPNKVLVPLHLIFIDTTNNELWAKENIGGSVSSFVFSMNSKSTTVGEVHEPNIAQVSMDPKTIFPIGNGNTLTVSGIKGKDQRGITGTRLDIIDSNYTIKNEKGNIFQMLPGDVMTYSDQHLYMWSPVYYNNQIFVRLTDLTLPKYSP